jgi:hypothetical protein
MRHIRRSSAAAALAASLWALPSAARPYTEGERGMAQAVAVDRVASFEDAGGPAANLTLKDGTALLVPRDEQRFAHWSTRLEEEQASGDFVYVAYDPATRRVSQILAPHPRRIEAVGAEPEGERLKVQLFMSPTTNFIRTTRPDYAELRARLTAAVASNEELLVTTSVDDLLEVLDARPVPPAN